MMKNAPKFSYVSRKIAALFVLALSLAFISSVANASRRVALVVGNSAYENAPTLANPRNDAEDLSRMLTSLGFEVISGFDLSSRGMREKVREFGAKLRQADVGLFFYAGHAMQVGGRNYLAPVDTNIQYESDLDFETIPMDFIQRQMERETKTTLLFLDACRNNPLLDNLKGKSRALQSTRGLARETNSSEGTFISFATQPDNVALDGSGRNSPFTKALLDNLARPGIEISTLMTDVRRQVFEATDEKQIPWINSSLLGRFYFKGGEESAKGEQLASLGDDRQTLSGASSKTNSEPDQLTSMRLEKLAWEAVKDSSDTDELRAFVNAYGSGFFGDLAKLRIARIEKSNSVSDDKPKETKTASLDNSDASRKIQIEKVVGDEPTDVPKPVTRDITRQIQSELNRIGCVAGPADGLWGKNSIRALGSFSKHAKVHLATLQPTHELLGQLRTYSTRICPVSAAPVAPVAPPTVINRQVNTCQPGQKLSRKGFCYWPQVKQAITCQSGQRLSPSGNCYWPGQTPPRQVIIQQQPQQAYVPQQQPQPQRRQGLLGAAIGGAVGGVIVNCAILKKC